MVALCNGNVSQRLGQVLGALKRLVFFVMRLLYMSGPFDIS